VAELSYANAIRHQIADFAARRRLPAIYGGLTYVETGAAETDSHLTLWYD